MFVPVFGLFFGIVDLFTPRISPHLMVLQVPHDAWLRSVDVVVMQPAYGRWELRSHFS